MHGPTALFVRPALLRNDSPRSSSRVLQSTLHIVHESDDEDNVDIGATLTNKDHQPPTKIQVRINVNIRSSVTPPRKIAFGINACSPWGEVFSPGRRSPSKEGATELESVEEEKEEEVEMDESKKETESESKGPVRSPCFIWHPVSTSADNHTATSHTPSVSTHASERKCEASFTPLTAVDIDAQDYFTSAQLPWLKFHERRCQQGPSAPASQLDLIALTGQAQCVDLLPV